MYRKLSLVLAAAVVLTGCATGGYGYRGGSGDYYYGRSSGSYYDGYHDGYGYPYSSGYYGGYGYPYSSIYYGGGYYGGYGYPYYPYRPRPDHDDDRPHRGELPPRARPGAYTPGVRDPARGEARVPPRSRPVITEGAPRRVSTPSRSQLRSPTRATLPAPRSGPVQGRAAPPRVAAPVPRAAPVQGRVAPPRASAPAPRAEPAPRPQQRSAPPREPVAAPRSRSRVLERDR